jgi:hypothetical protein
LPQLGIDNNYYPHYYYRRNYNRFTMAKLFVWFLSKNERLLRAAEVGDSNEVRRLLAAGANANARNRWVGASSTFSDVLFGNSALHACREVRL